MTAALVDRYRIERELGRGGMASVYLAHDLKHDRPVALKVLHPHIADSLGSERFLREVRLTARLQHPHILPVFDSGAIDGRPWYTMPYVRGESLRQLLRREVQLPVEASLEIARHVALALESAHREGIVHRDIKPENILLSQGQALVADFGVARALDLAADEALTGTGMAIGTPAYMAPEQASAGAVDVRTDVYALGCVLYEMLAGEPPFTGPTPQAIIAKRLAHPVPSLLVARPTVPRALDEAIRKAMAPVPADRFANAAQFAGALAAGLAVPVAVTPRRTKDWSRLLRRRGAMWGLGAAVGLGMTAAGYLTIRALKPPPATLLSTGVWEEREQVLIADFESHTQDSLLGPAVTQAFRIDLAGSPVVRVMAPARVADALERMRRPATSPLDAALGRELAMREGIKAVVTGQVARLATGFLISAQLVSAKGGEILAAHRETAPDSAQVIAAVDRLSGRLREAIGEPLRSLHDEPPLTRVTTGSLEALLKYSEGQLAADADNDYVRAVALLEEAVALDTGFATAYRTLGGAYSSLGDRERAVAAMTKAVNHRDRLTEMERQHTLGNYHVYVTGKFDQASVAYRAALQREPNDSLARNNLGATYLYLHQPLRAESILRGAVDTVRPWSPNEHFNLATALIALGRRAEAKRIYQQGTKLFPNHRGFEAYGINLANSEGDYRTANSRALALRSHYADNPLDRAVISRDMAAIALARGRLAEAERYTRDAMAASVEAGRPSDYLKDVVVLGFTNMWFRRQPAHGLRTVEAALARYPLASIKPLERPYLTLAFAYASMAKPQQARALLLQYERGINPILRGIDEPLRRWTWGHVAMAEGRFVDAITEFEAYLPTPRACLPCGQAALAQAYDRSGNADSAIAVYQRYVTTPDVFRLNDEPFDDDATQLAPACKRLGELYEQRGDRANAMKYYSRFVELWQDADPELRPAVMAVQQRLGQLRGEGPALQ